MIETISNQYTPELVSLPGETLLEILEDRGISQAELADRMGRPKKTINEIIKGKAAITHETALQLEKVLGIPASFWNNLERNYRDHLARRKERRELKHHLDWLERIPVREMIRRGWISGYEDKVDQLRSVLEFFGVASPDQWNLLAGQAEARFRQSSAFEVDPGAVSAWLRKGEILAREISCEPFEKGAFRRVLDEIRRLTREEPSTALIRARRLCAGAGVALVLLPALPRSRVSGVSRWLAPNRALIQLSGRFKTDVQLWFTLFHEAGHLLLHSKKAIFLDGETRGESKAEREANAFAADLLIPPDEWARIRSVGNQGKWSYKKVR
jgi:addiction module HigA family antidote